MQGFSRKTLDTINKEIIKIVESFVSENKIIDIKNVGDKVFSRDGTNIAINTTMATTGDIQDLIDANKKYEDDGFDFADNVLINGKGIIGINTVITIDSGSKESSQAALTDNGFVLISLYNYLKSIKLPSSWKLYDIRLDIPTWFPYHSSNIYSLIEIRGLYEV